MFDIIVALVPGLPLLAAVANGVGGLLGDRYSWRVVQRVASGALLLSLAACLWVFGQVLLDPTPREVVLYRWLVSGPLTVDVAFLVDSLSAVMMLVTTGISFLVAIFSINYMHNERGFTRYFTVLPLFVFAMLVLVMANNFILLFLGWEGVGVCSYLLIGFYYDRKAAVQAGTKAFVMNRVGDAGFLMGIFLLISNFGTANYTTVLAGAPALDVGTATAIGLCLLLGAAGKSAQFPLVTWLARAMEGPTPSSALIHAATMVTAGVYMIARSHAIYDRAPDALLGVAVVGAATALFGALVGLVQTDIKSLLAYSTTSQLGLMFLACGLGAYTIAIFHLAAHAVFKTLLFLTAPSILHQLHGGGDVRALATSEKSPGIYRLLLIGAVGLAVLPFLSIWWQGPSAGRVWTTGLPLLVAFGLLALFAAAVSTARLVRLTFSDHGHAAQPRSSGGTPRRLVTGLAVPAVLVALGVAAGVLPGGIEGTWMEGFLESAVAARPGVPLGSPVLAAGVMALIVLILLTGWFTPLYFERFQAERPGALLFKHRRLYGFVVNRLWLDELYDVTVVQPARRLGLLLSRIDGGVIDRALGTGVIGRRRAAAWEERRLAAQVSEAALAATGSRAGAEPSAWAEGGPAGATGLFGLLTRAGADAGGWIEREGIGRAGGALGSLAEMLSGVSAWIEGSIIRRLEDLVGSLTEAIAVVAARVERSVFHVGVHVGVPSATGRVGRLLNATEEALDQPLFIGALVFLAFVVVLLVDTL
jgi:NADH-quinone oxidoreductase subunit L